MSNSDRHNNYPLPNILVGGANGALKGGQHVELPEYTPFSNLQLTVLNKAGLDMKSIGDSTRRDRGRLVASRRRRCAASRRAVLRGSRRLPRRRSAARSFAHRRRGRRDGVAGTHLPASAVTSSCSRRDAAQIVVDSGGRSRARSSFDVAHARRAARRHVAALFNTHWHLDQVGANEPLGAPGATIVAHEKTRQRLTRGLLLAGRGSLSSRRSRPKAGRRKRLHTQARTTAVGEQAHRVRLSARGAHGRRHLRAASPT